MGRQTAERSSLKLLLHFWLPALAYAAMVLFVGSRPNLRPPLSFENADKVLHILEYFGLGLFLTRAARATWVAAVPAALLALCVGILVGTCDELMFRGAARARSISWRTPSGSGSRRS